MVNLTIRESLNNANSQLKAVSSCPTLDSRVLLCHVLRCDSSALICKMGDIIPINAYNEFNNLVQRRLNYEPIAYILGYKDFMSLEIKVGNGVLIPRPDTEILVESVIERFKGKNAEILELCTGGGCIAVALAKYLPQCKIKAVDISDDAINIANENVLNYKLDERVSIIKKDVLLMDGFDGQRFDCIVSNPPYIMSTDVNELMPDVKDFEPHLALDGGEDGLVFYRKISNICGNLLKKDGLVAVEIGAGMADDVAKIFGDVLKNICVIKDLTGIDRVVLGYLK